MSADRPWRDTGDDSDIWLKRRGDELDSDLKAAFASIKHLQERANTDAEKFNRSVDRLDAALRRIEQMEREVAVLKGPKVIPQLREPVACSHTGGGSPGCFVCDPRVYNAQLPDEVCHHEGIGLPGCTTCDPRTGPRPGASQRELPDEGT